MKVNKLDDSRASANIRRLYDESQEFWMQVTDGSDVIVDEPNSKELWERPKYISVEHEALMTAIERLKKLFGKKMQSSSH